MNIYEFTIEELDPSVIYVLAHTEYEACTIINKKYNLNIDDSYTTDVYDSPGIISIFLEK